MSFLFPLYLLGAAAIALPLYLHLKRRPPKDAVAFSTLVLRYHWPIDAIVGFFAVPLWLRACDAMLDRDGAARDQPIW